MSDIVFAIILVAAFLIIARAALEGKR
jgi:hypothetical protein